MKRIAIFTEGQTELIFVRYFLINVFDPSKISFECYELIAHNSSPVPYKFPNPNAETHFLIVNVNGDEGVLSSIKEREKNLIEEGKYEKIIGLRDMYCHEYLKRSLGVINDQISELIIQRHNQTISCLTYPNRVKLFFAIMEIEAWFLVMHRIFSKIDSLLTEENINKKLGIDLLTIDPQKQFFKPSEQVHQILQLCGRQYKKKQSEIECICSNIDSSDLDLARNQRCLSFRDFREEIISIVR